MFRRPELNRKWWGFHNTQRKFVATKLTGHLSMIWCTRYGLKLATLPVAYTCAEYLKRNCIVTLGPLAAASHALVRSRRQSARKTYDRMQLIEIMRASAFSQMHWKRFNMLLGAVRIQWKCLQVRNTCKRAKKRTQCQCQCQCVVLHSMRVTSKRSVYADSGFGFLYIYIFRSCGTQDNVRLFYNAIAGTFAAV